MYPIIKTLVSTVFDYANEWKDELSQGYLIANDENGNVKLREVVSFKSNDSDEIL